MQRREVNCRVAVDDNAENVTLIDSDKCDEAVKPPQRQECYNEECKGAWRVGEWSEVSSINKKKNNFC